MRYDEFLAKVRQRAGIDSDEEAVAAIRATLNVLADRLHGGQPTDILSELPPEVLTLLSSQEMRDGAAFGLDGFVERVSEQEGTSTAIAGQHIRGVLATVREVISRKELHDTLAQLPPEFTTQVEVATGESVQPPRRQQ